MNNRSQKDKKLFDNIAYKYALKDHIASTKLVRQHEVISSLKLLGGGAI